MAKNNAVAADAKSRFHSQKSSIADRKRQAVKKISKLNQTSSAKETIAKRSLVNAKKKKTLADATGAKTSVKLEKNGVVLQFDRTAGRKNSSLDHFESRRVVNTTKKNSSTIESMNSKTTLLNANTLNAKKETLHKMNSAIGTNKNPSKNKDQSSALTASELSSSSTLKMPNHLAHRSVKSAVKEQGTFSDLKQLLLQQKSAILNKSVELNQLELSTSQDGVLDEADIASRQLALNVTLNLHDRDRQSLLLIERALNKMSSGTYGLCDQCQTEIGFRRLQARPFAGLCIDCMHDLEDVKLGFPPN